MRPPGAARVGDGDKGARRRGHVGERGAFPALDGRGLHLSVGRRVQLPSANPPLDREVIVSKSVQQDLRSVRDTIQRSRHHERRSINFSYARYNPDAPWTSNGWNEEKKIIIMGWVSRNNG